MKTTFDIPEDLHRKVKAKSASEGRPIRAVAIELFRRWVDDAPPQRKPFVSALDMMRDVCGSIDSGAGDLATNRAYLEELGQDSLGNR